MQTVVIVVHLMIVLAMIGVVLLQRSEGGGLGTGSPTGFLSSRGTANVLTRTTAFLAMAFFATSLLLSILAGMNRAPRSILPAGETPASSAVPGVAPPAPSGGGPVAPAPTAPAPSAPAPAAPSGPQVPQSR